MTTMEFALAAVGLVKVEPEEQVTMECKDCTHRRNDGFCKKIKKHRARRAVSCTKIKEKK